MTVYVMAASSFIILLAHGSSDPHWVQPFLELEQIIRQQEPAAAVAFMELAEPSLETLIARASAEGYQQFSVLPLFFAAGRHLRQDVPRQIQRLETQFQVSISLLPPVGEHPLLTQAIVHIAKDLLQGQP